MEYCSYIPSVDAPGNVIHPELFSAEPVERHAINVHRIFGAERRAIVTDFKFPRDPGIIVGVSEEISGFLPVFEIKLAIRVLGNDDALCWSCCTRRYWYRSNTTTVRGVLINNKFCKVTVDCFAIGPDKMSLDLYIGHSGRDVVETNLGVVWNFDHNSGEVIRSIFCFDYVAVVIFDSPIRGIVGLAFGICGEHRGIARLDMFRERIFFNCERTTGPFGKCRRGRESC